MKVAPAVFAAMALLTACDPKLRDLDETVALEVDSEVESASPGQPEAPTPLDGSGAGELGAKSPPLAAAAGLESENMTSIAPASACAGDAGSCSAIEDAGPSEPVCVPTGARDCSSPEDNDCDGQSDNAVDDVCVCAPGSVEPCEEHPGLDGRGQCQAGSRSCIIGDGNLSSDWGACEGSVGPGEQDSCAVAGDDTDCDGTDNGGCPCVDGQTQPCGPNTEAGLCQLGVQTCVNARFGECEGAVFPAARNCGSQQDNDCDGRPDNTIDNVCTCAIGSVQACGTHPGRDGNGQCRAGSQRCEARANNTTSTFGSCTGSVGPAAQDSCAEGNDGNCNGIVNEGCACINGQTRTCGPDTDTGVCQRGSQTCVNGSYPQCQGAVFPAPRNCGSQQDNDCDGRPDNTIDNVCTCAIGTAQACGAHPGQDGTGQCRAGQRQCAAGATNASSAFGACAGSVGPAAQDSCTTLGNDANCDGTANGGCACVAGQGNGPCSDTPNTSRCNGQGQCVPCQADGDCSLISGGRNTCDNGQCEALQQPFGCGVDDLVSSPHPSIIRANGSPPEARGGVIAEGMYIITQVRYFGNFFSVQGERLELRGGFFRRQVTVFSAASGGVLTGFSSVGSYTTTGGALVLNATTCVAGFPNSQVILNYTATPSQLEITRTAEQVSVSTYSRQP